MHYIRTAYILLVTYFIFKPILHSVVQTIDLLIGIKYFTIIIIFDYITLVVIKTHSLKTDSFPDFFETDYA